MTRSGLVWAAAALLTATNSCALTPIAAHPATTQAGRVATQVNEAQVVTLAGNVHPLARAEFEVGVAPAGTRLNQILLLLKPSVSQQAALDALVTAQHDPQSPLYHKWLTPVEYGARFGVSTNDLARITQWLAGHGFTVNEIPSSRQLIVFSGTAAQVADTFHTEMRRYRVNGAMHIANSQNPQIPQSLAGVVGGVVSLNDFRHAPQMSTRRALGTRPEWNLFGSHYLFPADFATIYDVNPLYTAGTDGAGISIALVGRSNIHLDDVATFRAAAGLAANNPAVVLPGTDPGLVKEDQDEATLDVEWAGAVAPAAAVKLVAGASTSSTDGVDLAAAYAVNHLLAQVVSVSYGSCEQAMGSTEMAFYNSLWEQAASEGITAVVASGDSGAAGCEAGSAATGTVAAVNGLCSSPYATCVGGTEFNEGSDATQYWAGTNGKSGATALGYIPETVWNESSANGGMALWASGGGASRVYRQPAWQQEVSGAAAANGMRAVPDVSLTAAGHDGYVTCENGSYWEVSGTSSAAPAFAGVLALVAQAGGKVGLGNANPALYGLVNAPVNPFHATQFGNNSVPGVPGFAAGGTDYNLATGLGSVDAASLVEAWGAGGTTRPALEINAEPGSLLLIPGGTSTVTLHIAASGSFAGSVTLSAAGLPAGVTAEWNGNPVLNGTGTATLTLRASLLASTGTAVVAVTARGGGVSMGSTIPLQVQATVFHLRGSPVRPVSQRNW